MEEKYKIAFATGSRAEYGIMRNYLRLLNEDKDIDLLLLVTGSLLDNRYGKSVSLIYEDGFNVAASIDYPIDTSSNEKVIHSMAILLDKFGVLFSNMTLDLLILLGDRYEMLPIAIAASMKKIPILHIHGGEATFGNYDEFIRHSITKMSAYHFTSTEAYRKRVIQLGEMPDRVYNFGALGAENCLEICSQNVPKEIIELPKKKYFVVLFHPETLTNMDTMEQINILLNAIDMYPSMYFVFLGSNADTHSEIIREKIRHYVSVHNNSVYFENLHSDAYHYLVKNSVCLIGNSSSGIIEAPTLGVFSINIGHRQDGRVRGNSVIDVPCDSKCISDAMRKVLDTHDKVEITNPYFKESAASLYYEQTKLILKKLKDDLRNPKVFYDL